MTSTPDQLSLDENGKKPIAIEGAASIYDAIVAAHAAPEWSVFAEVSDATGGRASRRADALALNLWPSRGLEIRGFEIKVSRSDLKRELDDPSKADAIGVYCHTWSLAVPKNLVRPSDPVPPAWGIFEVENHEGRFKRLPTARPIEEVKAPTRMFMAAIARAAAAEVDSMRKGGEWLRRSEIQEKLDAEFKRGQEAAPNLHRTEIHDLKTRIDYAAPILAELGVDLAKEVNWKLDRDLAEALKIARALMSTYGSNIVKHVATDVERAIDGLREVWVDDPAQRDRGTAETARAYAAAKPGRVQPERARLSPSSASGRELSETTNERNEHAWTSV